MIFHDRHSAARQLLPLLDVHKRHPGVVVALPRGGVPMAAEIAAHLGWPMHVLAVKKLPHPDNPEFAIGAVGLTNYVVPVQHADVPKHYVEREVGRIQQLLRKREESYHQLPLNARGKTVIVVDDGIATGLTLRFAVDQIRSQNPRSIIVAVPVAASEAVHELHSLVDEFIVLHVPACFGGVGEWYENFEEVTDEEVLRTVSEYSSNVANSQSLERVPFGR